MYIAALKKIFFLLKGSVRRVNIMINIITAFKTVQRGRKGRITHLLLLCLSVPFCPLRQKGFYVLLTSFKRSPERLQKRMEIVIYPFLQKRKSVDTERIHWRVEQHELS